MRFVPVKLPAKHPEELPVVWLQEVGQLLPHRDVDPVLSAKVAFYGAASAVQAVETFVLIEIKVLCGTETIKFIAHG